MGGMFGRTDEGGGQVESVRAEGIDGVVMEVKGLERVAMTGLQSSNKAVC